MQLFSFRLKLLPRVYIILDRMHNFLGISGDLPKNLLKLSAYGKFYHLGNQAKKPAFYAVNACKPLFILGRI